MKTSQAIIDSALASGFRRVGQSLGTEQKQGEKCYGIAKAGKNDCQTANSACAGSNKEDGNPSAGS